MEKINTKRHADKVISDGNGCYEKNKFEWWDRGWEGEEEATWYWGLGVGHSRETHVGKKEIGMCVSGEQVIQAKGRAGTKAQPLLSWKLKPYKGDIFITLKRDWDPEKLYNFPPKWLAQPKFQ